MIQQIGRNAATANPSDTQDKFLGQLGNVTGSDYRSTPPCEPYAVKRGPHATLPRIHALAGAIANGSATKQKETGMETH